MKFLAPVLAAVVGVGAGAAAIVWWAYTPPKPVDFSIFLAEMAPDDAEMVIAMAEFLNRSDVGIGQG